MTEKFHTHYTSQGRRPENTPVTMDFIAVLKGTTIVTGTF